jgi:hypothetical protein
MQFFFDAKTSIGQGHMYFPLSEWGLSSISQSEFWSERGGFADGYFGVLSVDVSNTKAKARLLDGRMAAYRAVQSDFPAPLLNEEEEPELAVGGAGHVTETDAPAAAPAPDPSRGAFKLAREVWEQLKGRIGKDSKLPEPRAFHVDENAETDADGNVTNTTPYLAALPGTWSLRPGLEGPGEADGVRAPATRGKTNDIRYAINYKRWVLAGTFMATHTRMTTMEAANESGRHAARAILEKLGARDSRGDYFAEAQGQRFAIHTGENSTYNHASERRQFDAPDVWDPEDYEHEDLAYLRQVDAKLFAEGLPHWMDICDFDKRLAIVLDVAELDRTAGLRHLSSTEDLIKSTVASVEAVTGRSVAQPEYQRANAKISELVRKFLS